MTQKVDTKQVVGLPPVMEKVAGLANIKHIGNHLELTQDGTLNATGGGGGGGVELYNEYGNKVDGALTQRANTQLFVHTAPDGTHDLITNSNKIADTYLPDSILGQVIYGGGFVPNTAVATLTLNAKTKLKTLADTIVLTNDASAITGYVDNEGIFYICSADGTFAGINFLVGDWIISDGSRWQKVDNTDAVTGVKGNNETNYRLGNVNLTPQNIGAVSATDLIETSTVTPVVTTGLIVDGAVTTAKINNGAVTSGKIDYTTLKRWMPDYANMGATNLWTGSSYTATNTGWLKIYVYGYDSGATHTTKVFVNGNTVWRSTCESLGPQGARAVQEEFVLPISAGDTITQQGADQAHAAYFIPGKWV